MALAVGEPRLVKVTISDIKNVLTAGAGETLQAVPGTLAAALNTLWAEQEVSAQAKEPTPVYEAYQYGPLRRNVLVGYDDEVWPLVFRSWSPLYAELTGREATFSLQVIYNDAEGIQTAFQSAVAYTITGYPIVEHPLIDSTRSSAQNTTTINIEPKVTNFFNGAVNTLHRDIPGYAYTRFGVNMMAGLKSYLTG